MILTWIRSLLLQKLERKKSYVGRLRWQKAMLEQRLAQAKKQNDK